MSHFRQVHLDFHTSEHIEGIGTKFEKKEFQNMLKRGHVDSITLFAKCHHGWSYHATKIGKMHPHLTFDLLKEQIEAAHEIGVKTPVYLSAGYDERMVCQYPEWMADDEYHSFARDNFTVPRYKFLCMNSDYLDYLIEQIKEVVRNYDVDGIFLDIASVRPCYCSNCMKIMLQEGKSAANRKHILEMAERTYEKYAKAVRNAVHQIKPGLPIFHNGGHIPQGRRDLAHTNDHLEIESLPTGGWGYDHFPISVKYAPLLEMDYLGMTGKFHGSWGEFGGFKHPNALRYEVSMSISNGAKCSVGDQLAPNGRMDPVTYDLIGSAYKEVEEKEPWLDNVTSIADIGLFTSEAQRNIEKQIYFGATFSDSDKGACRMLQEGKYLYHCIDIAEDFQKYKVIILPDEIKVSGVLKEKLNCYVKNGGKILCSGTSGIDIESKEFQFDFGANYLGENEYYPDYVAPDFRYSCVDRTNYIMYGKGQKIELTDGISYAARKNPYFNRTAEHFCSHLHTPCNEDDESAGIVEGKDGSYIAWNIFEDYAVHGTIWVKYIVHYVLDRLLGKEKTLETNLPAQGSATLMKQLSEKRYIAHLLYASPVKRGKNIEIIEDVLPIYHTDLAVKIEEEVLRVYLAPQMEEIAFTREQEKISVNIPKIDCHQMIVFEYRS